MNGATHSGEVTHSTVVESEDSNADTMPSTRQNLRPGCCGGGWTYEKEVIDCDNVAPGILDAIVVALVFIGCRREALNTYKESIIVAAKKPSFSMVGLARNLVVLEACKRKANQLWLETVRKTASVKLIVCRRW